MADHDEALPELTLDDVMAFDPNAPDEAAGDETQVAESGSAHRDEQGRFAAAPKEPEAPVAEAQPGAREPIRLTPDEWIDFHAKMQATNPPKVEPPKAPEPPQFWEDPLAAVKHHASELLSPVEARMQQVTLFYSQRSAVQEFGQEPVQKAIDAITQLAKSNPAEYQRLDGLASKSMDPVGDLVRWHKRSEAMSKVGSDPDAFAKTRIKEMFADPAQREALMAELGLADASPQASAADASQPAPKPRAALPISLSKAPTGKGLQADDQSLEALLH